MFIDGENLSIRYKAMFADRDPADHVVYLPDVYLWTDYGNLAYYHQINVLRKNYYTCLRGDADKIENAQDALKQVGIENPQVFKKNGTGRSKKVDISLAVDLVNHAYRDNFDIAILVAGDEDYIPVVDSVKQAGKRVVLWFIDNGLSRNLKISSDHYFDMGHWLGRSRSELSRTWLGP